VAWCGSKSQSGAERCGHPLTVELTVVLGLGPRRKHLVLFFPGYPRRGGQRWWRKEGVGAHAGGL